MADNVQVKCSVSCTPAYYQERQVAVPESKAKLLPLAIHHSTYSGKKYKSKNVIMMMLVLIIQGLFQRCGINSCTHFIHFGPRAPSSPVDVEFLRLSDVLTFQHLRFRQGLNLFIYLFIYLVSLCQSAAFVGRNIHCHITAILRSQTLQHTVGRAVNLTVRHTK